jgi:hypothetical protein
MSSISKINISDTDYTLNASSINDYNNSARKIQVGFAGEGLTSSNLGYVAGYTADGTKIKDVNKAQMQSWLGLGSAMKFIGTTTTALTDGATTNPITISSTSVTATSGNVVLYGNKEFLWNGSTSKWKELGDESSHALKTVSIKAGTGLSGGGTLEADRTLSLSAATSSTLGGIKTGYTESGKNYKVQLDSSNNAYVNVPWTDTNTNQTVKGNGTAFGSTAVINIVGSGATTVTADTTNNNITISSTDTNTWRPVVDNLTSSTATTSSLSAKQGYLLANGSAKDNNAIASLSASGTTITYTKRDGSTGTITTQDTNTNTAHTHTAGTGLSITGSGGTSGGVTYTLNKATESTIGGVRVGKTITDTSSYTQCPVDSNGTVYYKDTNTNTTYSAGKGLSLSGTTFSLDSSKPNIMFGVCETAGATAVKVCIIKNGDINLNDGTIVNIFFKYANTAYPDQTCVSFTTNADGSNPVNPMNMYSGYTSAAVAANPSYVDRVWGNIQFGTTYTFVIYNSKLYLLNDSNGAKAFNYCDTTITIDAFLTNVLGHGAAMGSFFLKTAFSKNNVTVSASRYYYIFLPYRDGVVNSSTDDTNVRGCLILVQGYVAAGNTYGKTGYYVYIDECEVQKVQQFLPVTITPAYGTCSTAAATAAKEVTVPNVVELVAGTEITVYFSKGNTASNVTLNVNSLGAKSVRKAGNTTVGSSDLLVGIYKLVYSGSYWFII